MAALPLPIRAIGVGHLEQVAQQPPQPPGSSRRAASTSTGSASTVTWSGKSGCRRPGPGHGQPRCPIAHRLRSLGQRAPEQGPGRPDGPAAALSLSRSRFRSQPAVDPLLSGSAPAAPRPSTPPVPCASGRPGGPAPAAAPGPGRPGRHRTEPVQVLGGQPIGGGDQGGQLVGSPGGVPSRTGVRIHGENLSSPHPKASTKQQSVHNLPPTPPELAPRGQTANSSPHNVAVRTTPTRLGRISGSSARLARQVGAPLSGSDTISALAALVATPR